MSATTTSLCFLAFSLTISMATAQNSEPHPEETAALQLIGEANKAIASKEYAPAVNSLRAAVKLVPDDMNLRYKLVETLLAADRLPEMWYELRKASLKAPGHPDIARALLSYWKMFDEQGLFNCHNETMDKVISVLGGPDHMIKGPDRDRYIYGFIGIESKHGDNKIFRTLDLRGIKPEHLNPSEYVDIVLDGRGRKVGHRTINKGVTVAEYVLPNERVQNWTQLFSVQRLHGAAAQGMTLRQIAEGMMTSLAKTNPERKYRLLEDSDVSVTYEWTIPAKEGEPGQHEIARLMAGPDDVHRIAFVVKKEQMAETLREQWVEILGTAKLKQVTEALAPADTRSKAPPVTDEQAWTLGRLLSVAVFAHARKQEDTAKQNLVSAFRLARELELYMPAPFKLSDDMNANIASAVEYVVVKVPPVLRQRMSDKQVATYQLAVQTHTLGLLCSSQQLREQSIEAINRAAPVSELPKGMFIALNERIDANGSDEEIRTVISKLHADAIMYFNIRNNPRKPVGQKAVNM